MKFTTRDIHTLAKRFGFVAPYGFGSRALEAILDLGRHMLAKAMGKAVRGYKEIARELKSAGVITPETAEIFLLLAGYRERMVYFYHEIGARELNDICVNGSGDIERVLADILDWLKIIRIQSTHRNSIMKAPPLQAGMNTVRLSSRYPAS